MKRICVMFVMVSVIILTACVTMPSPKKPVVLIVPARYTVVQVAFDMLSLRPVTLLAYDSESDQGSPVMHIWHRQSRQWLRTTKAEYNSGAGIPTVPGEIIVVGSELDLPAGLNDAPPWCRNVRIIPTLRVADLVNELDKSLHFSPGEWRWLASKHRLKIKDHNAERRRYGKYGKPGSQAQVPMPEPEEDVIMPSSVERLAPSAPISPIDDAKAPADIATVDIAPDVAPEDK